MAWDRFGVVGAALACLALAACKPGGEEGAQPGAKPEAQAPTADGAPSAQERIARVETVKLSPMDFVGTAVLTGEAEAEDFVTVSAEMPGRVVASNFDEGVEVEAGQWLLRLDVQIDQTRVKQLETNLAQGRQDLARVEGLLEKGLATPAQVEQARMGVKNGEYSLSMARQGIGKAVVSSPIKGVVDREMLKVGEFAAPGVPVASIVNFDTLLVRAGVPESQVRWAQVGSTTQVLFPALGLEREGKIRRLGIQADRKSRTFPVVIEVENKDRAVRPGMRAEVTMKTEQKAKALMLPREAVIEGLRERAVFVVEGGVALRRVVEVGEGRGRVVEVLSGLNPGDEVILVGQRDLSDKDKVKVLKRSECCDASWTQEEKRP